MIFSRLLLRGPFCGFSARRFLENRPSKYTITAEKGQLSRKSLVAQNARRFSEVVFPAPGSFSALSRHIFGKSGQDSVLISRIVVGIDGDFRERSFLGLFFARRRCVNGDFLRKFGAVSDSATLADAHCYIWSIQSLISGNQIWPGAQQGQRRAAMDKNKSNR